MSSVTASDIKKEFVKSKIGITGIIILSSLVIFSVFALATIPIDTFKQWNNPGNWISYPKTAIPVWVNLFLSEKIPEHIIKEDPIISEIDGEISASSNQLTIFYNYDDFPDDFIFEFSTKYSGMPLAEIFVIKPDHSKVKVHSFVLPYSETETVHHERVFSTDSNLRKNLQMQNADNLQGTSESILFSNTDGTVQKGKYDFLINVYSVQEKPIIIDSKMIIGGKAFGMMGTDELRRDLAIGILWGTPLALFIGIAVAVGSVVMGLLYGVYAGYKGKITDESMMRFNDIIYALPALPFLIILAVTISNSIFLMIGFLMIFSWVGVAKVSRSMALQIKTRQYVEASKMMGQKDSKIILRHILPQLLPYAFASIAISVPAAITTEAGLSFLGLGDPTFPTWGQILHDANTYGAAARGLWWWIVPPGIMIAITGLAFVFIGNALDVIINPKLKR